MRFENRRAIARAIRGRARRFRTGLGRVLAVRSRPSGLPRVLFVVSRAVSKKSTERNRIKRVLDALAQKHLHNLDGCDIIVFVAPEAAGLRSEKLETLLRRLRAEIPEAGRRA